MTKVKDKTRKISVRIAESKLECLMQEYQTDNITDIINYLVEDKFDKMFSDKNKRSVITGIGTKNLVAKKIIDLMPKHSIYIEPFGNTASVLLQKERVKKEVYNDINKEVTHFFLVLRENPIGLYNACVTLPYSEAYFQELKNVPIPTDPVERAARFFFLNRGSFLGSIDTGFRYQLVERNFSKFYYKECNRFYAVSKRFQGVEILARDFRKVIKAYSLYEQALFLCDPPYYAATNHYNTPFGLKEHIDLAHLLTQIKGKCMVCHDKNYQIHKLYLELGFKYDIIETHYYSKKWKEDKKHRHPTELYIYRNFERDSEITGIDNKQVMSRK